MDNQPNTEISATSATEPLAFNADDTLVSLESPMRRRVIAVACIFALAVYAAYLVYRAVYTINLDALTFSLLVYFAELHGFVSLLLYFHQLWHLRGRRLVPAPAGLSVDVFVTTYNEDVDLLRQTVRAAVAMRYPHETYVLDDGRRPAVRALAAELGCHYFTRADNTHAKAGNWNNAFKQTRGELIATFDADHVPRPDYLERTLGYFRDPRVGLLQVPQQYHNLDSVQHSISWKTRRMYSEQDAFFNLVMPGKDNWNAAFFCGTGAVLRRKALEPHGGILTDTITEDLHTSIVLHADGWKSVYLNELLVTGLAPVDLKSFAVQRLRWAEGNLKAATLANPLTLRGLTLNQRLSYFASLFNWTMGLPKLIFYMAPPWILYSGTFPIVAFDRTFILIYLAFLGTLLASYHVASRGKGRLLMDELFNMVSFFTLLRAMKRVVFGRGKPGRFEVTKKRGDGGDRDFGPILPHLVLLGFSMMAISWSLMGLGFGVDDDFVGAGTAIFWTLYNATLMLIVLKIGGRPAEKRTSCRFRANFAVEAREGGAAGQLGVTADIADHGCSLLWPGPLSVGRHMPVRVHFGPKSVDWTAEVVSDQGQQSDGWHRYGIRFTNLAVGEVDVINDMIFSIVVPDLFERLSQPSWMIRVWRGMARALTKTPRAREARQPARVPVRVTHAKGSFVSTVRDLSETGLSIQAPVSLASGCEVTVTMLVPGHTWHGTASVVRVDARPSRAGFETWVIGLRFEQQQAADDVEPFRRWDAA